jgi:hypothetical protein
VARGGDAHLALAEAVIRRRWHAETQLHAELGLATPAPADTSTAGDEAAALRAVQGWLREADAAGVPGPPLVNERMEHLVAVRSAVARARRHTKFWAPATFWRADGIAMDLRQTPEQAATGGARDGLRLRQGTTTAGRGPTGSAAARELVQEIEERDRARGTGT